jgi:type II secretory pathway pseudopilin PulG
MNRIISYLNPGNRRQEGFLMPTVIILIAVMSSVAYATLIQANNSLNLSYKQSYIQMAREASKAAIDYSQEQFDNASCGNYNGTAETTLTGPTNNRYKITMQADVQSTSADGYEKKVIGTGRVYLPKTSSTALYVFDIRSEIVRTYAVCKTPDNFNPLVWLDASDINTLKTSTNSTTVISSGNCNNCGNGQATAVKERVDNGQQAASTSSNLEFHSCKASDFTTAICNSNATKYLYVGLMFQDVNAPKNSAIGTATLSLQGATPAGAAGAVTHRVCGIYETSTNPHKTLFSTTATGQVRNRMQTEGLHTNTCQDTTTNNFPPGNSVGLDVTAVVQEMVNNPNWDPANNGGRIGFAVYRMSGTGSRTAVKDSTQLSISYATGPMLQVANGGTLTQWNDKSVNQYHAKFAFGNAPTRQDNQINSRTVLRFNNGAMVSTLITALSLKREMTVLAVIKPNFSTSGSLGRVVSGMSATGTSDTTGINSIIPLRRQNNATGFSNFYDSNAGDEVTMGCNPACNNTPYLATSVFTIDTNNDKIIASLKGNGGAQTGTKLNIDPGSPPPKYTYSIDQLYLGGRRNGAMPGSGADYLNGDYAEIVIYDKALSCRQIESLEEYFRAKWAIAPSQWATTCPEDTIPTL